jgi:electron transfer flavoprotein beta subunit
MNIIVCYKFTPDDEDLVVKPDRSISLEKAEWEISEYDLNAVEAAMQLAEASEGKVLALSAGGSQLDNSKGKKDILSRGPDELYLVVDEAVAVGDTNLTARVLAAAIEKMGAYDLVLCGEGSSDLYFQQTGLQLGEVLGLPTINSISKVELVDGKLVAERSLEGDVEVLEVPMPAVLSVTTDINQPRLPSMKEILKAGKKPVTMWTLHDLKVKDGVETKVDVLEVKAPPQKERKRMIIPGKPEEAAEALVGYLSKEGVI